MKPKKRNKVETLLRSEAGQLALSDVALTHSLGDAVKKAMKLRGVSLYMMAKKLRRTESDVRALLRGQVFRLDAYSQAFQVLRVMPRVTVSLMKT